ncbi:MAG: 3-deoxy-8-phosphooctulonate synthase [Candidatus Omnitrophica bacterium]|nr:3-deoxy-8-phosphooctulonate synthase [Candidatus Omnitrophota bacterium]
MENKTVKVQDISIGKGHGIALIAGPCVIESYESAVLAAREIKKIARAASVPFIFKASFDKANRSSIDSYRGPGIDKGLEILKAVRDEVKVPVLSDVHDIIQVKKAAKVLDVLQIPAFLSRQTDLLVEAARTGKPVNVKKGQFMSPEEMRNVVSKMESQGASDIMLTERGTFFGYNMLVNDFRSIIVMGQTGYPVVFDATHSVQRPAGKGTMSGGDPVFILPLAKAAVALGADVLFLEVHMEPEKALSDASSMLRMDLLGDLLAEIKKIEKAVRI